MQLAKNLGCRGVFIDNNPALGVDEVSDKDLDETIVLKTKSWELIYRQLLMKDRGISFERKTRETEVYIEINLDGTGDSKVQTGLAFFDHMLDQLSRHGGIDLFLKTNGDLEIDEHHTIEDTAISLGNAFSKALGNKKGIERYGFSLPMDDALANVSIDFGGRSWLEWQVDFKREMIGEMPTEMFYHFFKSFC